jgi:hypothetical protein
VAMAHAAGEVTRTEHGPDGTFLEARVPPELAAELQHFVQLSPGGATPRTPRCPPTQA